MYAIQENRRTIKGKEIVTYKREVCSANILEVEAGTNGYHGGDTGSGSRTYIRIQDNGSTDLQVFPLSRWGRHSEELPCRNDDNDGVLLLLGGDTELETMIRALEFITKVLKDGAGKVYD